eukprot:GHUV01020794.1.p1 GENE.GHUV01020794.1~~GHUV01020794.1.p1  ORF type:complete len:152 (+),score=28.69 GHUV01020794.1:238-693(+)
MSLTNSPRVQPPYQQQPSQQQSQQLIQQRPPRKCAEVCLELLTTEAVKLFSEKQYGPAAPAALQAVGFRVGRQLAERYVRVTGQVCAVGWPAGTSSSGVAHTTCSGGLPQSCVRVLTCSHLERLLAHSIQNCYCFGAALLNQVQQRQGQVR